MNFKYLCFAFIVAITAAGCDKFSPKPPETAVDNSAAGIYNPANCIVANEACRNQLFRNITMRRDDVTFEFDSKNRLIKSTDVQGTTITYEYPDESTVVMTRWKTKDTFHIGANGFANKCVSVVDGYDFEYYFHYDKDGYLVSVYSDGGAQIIMDYTFGNLVHAKFINNCKEVDEECEFTYSNVSNFDFGYMPYDLYSQLFGWNRVPFNFDYVYTGMREAYLCGLIGKPVRYLPDTAVQTDNYGNKTEYYFHNQYILEPAYIQTFKCVLHTYGWSEEEAPALNGSKRIEHVATWEEEAN